MKLKRLMLWNTAVVDLSPLEGMPLEELHLGSTKVADLSVLRGMPLKSLRLHYSEIKDVGMLTNCQSLNQITVPRNAKNIELLRRLPNLERISFVEDSKTYRPDKTAAEFWMDYTWMAALRKAAITPNKQNQLEDGTWDIDLSQSTISELSVLRAVPISRLSVGGTAVTDLSPLKDMKLKALYLWHTKVVDLSPLRGMPLEELNLGVTKVADLSVLRGMPLKRVWLHYCSEVKDVALFANCQSLREITLPPNAKNIELLRKLPNLERISFDEDSKMYRPDKTAAEFWKDYSWVSALLKAGIRPKGQKQLEDGTWDIDLSESAISDLSILRAVPISRLSLGGIAVTDLSPLKDMKLKALYLWHTKVVDLSPLRGMPLEELNLAGTKVADLSVLRDMPLTSVRLHQCSEIKDVAALANCQSLRRITLPPNAKNIELLRKLLSLERISFVEDLETYSPDKSATEFWKEFDAKMK